LILVLRVPPLLTAADRQGGYWSTVAGVLWSGSHPAVVVCRGGSRGDGGESWGLVEGEFSYHRSYTTHQHAHLTERGRRERERM